MKTTAYAPTMVTINGLRLAFLAFLDASRSQIMIIKPGEAGQNKPGVAWAHEQKVRQAITSAKKRMLRWCWSTTAMKLFNPCLKHNKLWHTWLLKKRRFLVIGSHPTFYKGSRLIKNGLIVYSMGNFVFDTLRIPQITPASFPSCSHRMARVLRDARCRCNIQLNGVP